MCAARGPTDNIRKHNTGTKTRITTTITIIIAWFEHGRYRRSTLCDAGGGKCGDGG